MCPGPGYGSMSRLMLVRSFGGNEGVSTSMPNHVLRLVQTVGLVTRHWGGPMLASLHAHSS
ncbi:hypothetical protein BRAS3843_330096 [Bradyrhizobium sp. STM 3843]|nr:hypothetical protein BRAS3843_330096 [Bradyrhizobium sp. STM 3843]